MVTIEIEFFLKLSSIDDIDFRALVSLSEDGFDQIKELFDEGLIFKSLSELFSLDIQIGKEAMNM